MVDKIIEAIIKIRLSTKIFLLLTVILFISIQVFLAIISMQSAVLERYIKNTNAGQSSSEQELITLAPSAIAFFIVFLITIAWFVSVMVLIFRGPRGGKKTTALMFGEVNTLANILIPGRALRMKEAEEKKREAKKNNNLWI
jgi:hypothetical protein